MADDPRVEFAADAITYHPGNRTGTPDTRAPVSLLIAQAVIAAADTADKAADPPWVRVRCDETTVGLIARVIYQAALEHKGYRGAADAVVAALRDEQ